MDLNTLKYITENALLKILPPVVTLIYAIILLLIGLFISRITQKIVTVILKLFQFDEIVKKMNFDKILEKGEIKKPLSELLGDLIYWAAIFVVMVVVTNIFGLDLYPIINKVFSYLAIVVAAAIVLGLGVVIASLIANVIYVAGSNLGIGGSRTIAKIIQYAFIIFSFLLALEQLGIGSQLIVPSIGVIIGSVGLALAIAFGLGCKDMIADFVSNLVRNK